MSIQQPIPKLNMKLKFSFSKLFTKQAIIELINIASGSEANITTSCEMEIFNFLWLIWDHYLLLAPT